MQSTHLRDLGDLRRRVNEIEERVPWVGVASGWAEQRGAWVEQLQSQELTCAGLGRILLTLEGALLPESMAPQWAFAREGWRGRVAASIFPRCSTLPSMTSSMRSSGTGSCLRPMDDSRRRRASSAEPRNTGSVRPDRLARSPARRRLARLPKGCRAQRRACCCSCARWAFGSMTRASRFSCLR